MNIKNIVHWVLMLLWMGLIYYLSAQPAQASSELSSNVMHLLLQFIENIIEVDEAFFHHLVRKGAHLSAYFILGILTMFALGTSRFRGWFQVGIAFGICVLYAMSDEFHQLFVPGRSGELADVGIDATGALLGIGFYVIVRKAIRMWRA